MKADRQPVYDALNAMPDAKFAVLMSALLEMNKVLALVGMDDATDDERLAAAIAPWTAMAAQQTPKET